MSDVNEILKPVTEVSAENKSVQTREILVDQKPEAFAPREVQSFLQKIEQVPVATPTFDPTGIPQLTPASPTNPKISLPVTRTSFVAGFKKKVNDVGRWLSIFLFREIKLKEGNVSFKPDDS